MVFPSLHTTCIFVRAIGTVLLAVTEEVFVDADGITTGQLANLTEGLVCVQKGFHLLLPCQLITVLHSPLPITGLFFQVKSKTGRTTDGLQTLGKLDHNINAILY